VAERAPERAIGRSDSSIRTWSDLAGQLRWLTAGMGNKSICCIGAGYVGGPTMTMIAARCPDIAVTVVDVDAERIAAWNSNRLPIYEPGLEDVVRSTRDRNLFFSTDVDEGIRRSDIIFVSVNTPTKSYGIGAGSAADLRNVELCARRIAAAAQDDKIVVEKSTLPVRTAESLKRVLHANASGRRFEVLSNPEFLAEGTAVADLENPDRVLIGGESTPSGARAVQQLVDIYARWVPRERILTTNVWSSELSKLVSNALLAQRISSVNALSALCEATGADVDEVAAAAGRDSRIGPKFLKASVGFGGSCFQKDILNLVYLCRHYGLDEVADYWEQVVAINAWQKKRFVRRMTRTMFDTIAGKRIAVLGFAFKKDTDDTRESPAIDVCSALLAEQAVLAVYDPRVEPDAIFKELHRATGLSPTELEHRVQCEPDAYRAAAGAHALAVITEWDEFAALDFELIYHKMNKPAFAFDGRNILPHAELRALGFEVHAIGKPAESPTDSSLAAIRRRGAA
jgi:UDPglucose 6-dehydrogenase